MPKSRMDRDIPRRIQQFPGLACLSHKHRFEFVGLWGQSFCFAAGLLPGVLILGVPPRLPEHVFESAAGILPGVLACNRM